MLSLFLIIIVLLSLVVKLLIVPLLFPHCAIVAATSILNGFAGALKSTNKGGDFHIFHVT